MDALAHAHEAVVLDLPLCPTSNNLFLNPPKPHMRRPVNPIYTCWRWEAMAELAKMQPRPRVHGKYRLRILLPETMRGDASNRIKAAEDFLVAHGVTDDDRHDAHVSAEKSPDVEAGRMRLIVEEWRP